MEVRATTAPRVPDTKVGGILPPWICLFLVGALANVAPRVHAQPESRRDAAPLRIGIVSDGPSELGGQFRTLVRREVGTLLGEEYDVQFPDRANVEADWTLAGVATAFDRVVEDESIDVVIAIGILVGHRAATRQNLPKPVFLPLALDPDLQGLPFTDGRSGKRNLNYLTGLLNLKRDLVRFREIASVRRLTLVLDRVILRSVPGFAQRVLAATQETGTAAEIVAADDSAPNVLTALPEDTQGVYLGALPRMADQELTTLIEGLNARGLPSFAALGPMVVRLGALATVTPEEEWTRRARRVALNLQRATIGEDPATFPVVFEPREHAMINMAAARTIEVWPSFELLTEAELINQQRRRALRSMTLRTAVRQALKRNRDYAAARSGVRAGQQNVTRARAGLFPSLSASGLGRWTDPDIATPVGNQEFNASWSANANQVLYSERVYANLGTQKHVQRSLEHNLQQQRLDLVLSVIESYLNVLRAKTAERIQRENLARVRSHLTVAQVRKGVGVGRSEEVYRWEIEVANSRRRVIDASAARNQAEIELNRLLNRPLEEPFRIRSSEIEEQLGLDEARLRPFINNPWGFRTFRDFMVGEAVDNSPEIRAINASLAAQRRTLTGSRRLLVLPTFALQGGITHTFLREGEGSDAGAIPPEFSAIANQDDFTWQVGISASLPLFEGGRRYADIRQTGLRIQQLLEQRQSVVQQVEQRARATLHQAGASRPGARLAAQAARSAGKNLDLVADAYARGAVSVITLIDAQNQALVAELAAANAHFDFLTDYARVERGVGRFGLERDARQHRDFYRRLRTFQRKRARSTRRAHPGPPRTASGRRIK